MDTEKQLELRTASFELAQRQAKALAASTLVPSTFRENVGDCLIAMELAERLNAPTLQVMQHLNVIHGRPTFSAAFIIALINYSGILAGRLTFETLSDGDGNADAVRAIGIDANTGEQLVGTTVTLEMAAKEGWSTRSGSKWKTMPEQMLRYRAATFWQRVYAPELSVGLADSEGYADERPPIPVPGDASDKFLTRDIPPLDVPEAAITGDPIAASESVNEANAAPVSPGAAEYHEPRDRTTRAASADEPVIVPDDGSLLDAQTFPTKLHDDWIDAKGTIYDATRHGWNTAEKRPATTKDGIFRKRRSGGNTEESNPDTPQTAVEADDGPPVETEATGSAMFRGLMTRVAGATIPADLEGLAAHPSLETMDAGELRKLKTAIKHRAAQMAG